MRRLGIARTCIGYPPPTSHGAYPPGVQYLLDPPTDLLGRDDATGSLQDHHMKDDEPLQVPQSAPHSTQPFHQCHHKVLANLPAWRVIALRGNYREVTPPPLTILVVPDSAMKVSARVGVNPAPVDLLDSEFLRGCPLDPTVGLSYPVAPLCGYLFGEEEWGGHGPVLFLSLPLLHVSVYSPTL